jgi:hypothetical protein
MNINQPDYLMRLLKASKLRTHFGDLRHLCQAAGCPNYSVVY